MFEMCNKEINLIEFVPNTGFSDQERESIHYYLESLEQINNILIKSTTNNLTDFIQFAGYYDTLNFMSVFIDNPFKVKKEINNYILSHIRGE